jgi:hypothetical protein
VTWDKTKDELRQETIRQTNKRKKTGKWCRGKVGVEHTPEIVVNHSWTARSCSWYPLYFSFKRRDEGPRGWRYACRHSLRCTSCGKYVETFLGVEQCPDAYPSPE